MVMIRIANIVEEGRFGGPQARIVLVADHARKLGIQTRVIFPKIDSEELERRLEQRNIDRMRVNMHRLTKQRRHLLPYLLCFLPEVVLLAQAIRAVDADIVHCNGSWQIKGALAGKLAGKKVVWHLNDTMMAVSVKAVFDRIAGGLADGFIVAGKRVFDYYLQGTPLAEKPWTEIHAPVDTSSFDQAAVQADERMSSAAGKRILTVANINPRKGLEDFIEAAAVLSGRSPDLHFYVAGPTFASQERYSRSLRDLARAHKLENLTFLGGVSDVRPLMKAADVFLFTSLNEASPTSVWEAMSMGKAIVSTDVGSVGQYVRDGVNGYVVPPGDVPAMVQRIELLLKDEKLRAQIGGRAREDAVRSLGIARCAEMHAAFYARVLGTR